MVPIFLTIASLLPGGEIYLTHKDNNNFHIVEVNAKDLAHPFFGTSFHLHFNQDQYKYDHYSLGSYFEADDNPLVQVAQKDEKIIIGISLKRGSLITRRDGTLVKLFFTQKTLIKNPATDTSSFSLASAVYSTYDNGRKDIPTVKFSSSAITN